MVSLPGAREEEFHAAVQLLNPRPGMTVLDVPSGGGYLRRYVSERVDRVRVVGEDPSPAVAALDSETRRCTFEMLPFDRASADGLVSLATRPG
jgi:cyclopropane fatty-acyl-phospholipid synthase-like methyltransferase